MKKRWLVAPILIAALLVCALPACSSADSARVITAPLSIAQDMGSGSLIWSQQSVGLWVSADGKVTATPDIALLYLGVESQEKSVAEAQRKANEAMEKVMKALRAKGIADKDIQTQNFTISPVFQWMKEPERNEIIGYRISNTVIAKIRQISNAGSVIDEVAIAAGDLIRINNIDFTVDEPMPYYKDARAKAVAYATDKAKQMADAAGVKLGKLLYMTENVQYYTPVVRNYLKMDSAMGSMPAASPTEISAGTLDFQTTVQMVYEIR